MKLTLRVLSVILSVCMVIMLFESLCFVLAEDNSATFEQNPIIVTPFTQWQSHSASSKVTQEVVSPLEWSDVNGLKITANTQYTNDYTANSLAFARFKTDGEFVLGDAKYIIMYVKTDSANVILPAIGYNGSLINIPYDPLMTIGVGKPYSYLEINSNKWVEGYTVPTWKSGSGDTDGDGISDTYFGGIEFEEAFEGYIKFAVSDLSNDTPKINAQNISTTKISMFNLSVSRIGGEYGTVTAGPIFMTDSDSGSTEILTPEMEVIPFENYTVERAGGYGNSVYPIDDCYLSGETLARNIEWDVKQTQFASISSSRLQFSNINQAMKDTQGYMFYLSVPENTTTTFIMVLEDPNDTSRWRFSYPPSMLPIAEKEYYFLSDGDTAWKSEKLVYTNDNNSKYRAGIYFKDGFTGYIKIPYSSLGNDSGFKFNPQLDTLSSTVFYFSRFGGKYGQVIAGPNFFVLNDGTNNQLELKGYNNNRALELNNYKIDKDSKIGTVENTVINKELKINGAVIYNDTLLECPTDKLVGDVSERYVNFNYNNEALCGTDGLLLYLRLPDKNLLTATAVLEYPEDKDRWNISYQPVLSLYEGESCYVLPLGEEKWQEKIVIKASKNSYSGGLQFDGAFEGYVKIPYSALKNDSGLIFSSQEDILKTLSLKFERIGGDYGAVAVSDAYLLECSSSSPDISLISTGEIAAIECDNGTVSVDNSSAYFGQRVGVSVAADDGYTLKTDGLYIEYFDFCGKQRHLVTEYNKADGKFYFEMPQAENVTLGAQFVRSDEKNFAVLEPVALDGDSLEFTFREFENSVKATQKGVLIALENLLGGKELSIDLEGVDFINATFTQPDNGFSLQGDRVYNDYVFCLKNIKPLNLGRNYVVRGYQLIDDEYFYTSSVIVNYNEAKGQLISYESFPEIYINGSNDNISCLEVDMPCPELNYTRGVTAYTDKVYSTVLTDLQDSSYWFRTGFDSATVTDFNYIGIYIKVPETKENTLYLNFEDQKGNIYRIPAGWDYVLIDKKNGKKLYQTTLEGKDRYVGIVTFPAGFEGLLCLPVSALNPHNSINSNTRLISVTYRFGYIGSGENAVTVGPLVGFRQNGKISDVKEILPEIITETTEFNLDLSLTETVDNTAIFYWDNHNSAENYLIKAYKRVIGGYRLVSENILFSNSGSLDGLEKGQEYLLTLCARDRRDNILAEYSTEKFLFTPSEIYADIKQEAIIYDTVDYTNGNVKDSPFVNRSYTTLNAYNSALLNNNPNRGFRGCIDFFHFNLTKADVEKEIEKDIKVIKDNGYNGNVYVCYLYPGDYISSDLGSEFFETAQMIFDYLRENQIQILLRFAYYDINNFNQRTPTTDEALRHINQLSIDGIIERNKDVIHAFQVGFIGKYGEWHSDTPESTRADRVQVLNAFVEKLLPENIYAQLRMPNFKDFLSSENLDKYGDRFGFHLDSFYGIMDGSELGSGQYSYGYADWDRHIAEAYCTPNDAETYYCQQFDDIGIYPEGYGSAIAAAQLRLTTFSAVNGYLDQNVNASGCLNEWKKLPLTKNWLLYNNLPFADGWFKDNNSNTVNRSVFDYIRDYLGYRISADELSVVPTQSGMKVTLDLTNYGFSAAFNMSSYVVVLDEDNNVVCSKAVGNPEKWYGTNPGVVPDGELLTHTLSTDMETPQASGEYKLALQLVSKSGATARLDNNIPYEDGYNILHTFKIG